MDARIVGWGVELGVRVFERLFRLVGSESGRSGRRRRGGCRRRERSRSGVGGKKGVEVGIGCLQGWLRGLGFGFGLGGRSHDEDGAFILVFDFGFHFVDDHGLRILESDDVHRWRFLDDGEW